MDAYKFPSYVIIEHNYLLFLTFKEAIIFSIIYYKLDQRVNAKFQFNKSELHRKTGISINTINKALKKLECIGLINIIENDIYLSSTSITDEIENRVLEATNINNVDKSNYYTPFYFDLQKRLNINEIEYAFLHTYFTLSKKSESAYIKKRYFLNYFRIKERQYNYIRSNLLDKGHIEKLHNNRIKLTISTKILFYEYFKANQ